MKRIESATILLGVLVLAVSSQVLAAGNWRELQEQALSEMESGKTQEALEHIAEALDEVDSKEVENHSAVLKNYLSIHLQAGKKDGLESKVQAFLAEGDEGTVIEVAALYEHHGYLAEALKFYEQRSKASSSQPAIQLDLARVNYNIGEYKKASDLANAYLRNCGQNTKDQPTCPADDRAEAHVMQGGLALLYNRLDEAAERVIERGYAKLG